MEKLNNKILEKNDVISDLSEDKTSSKKKQGGKKFKKTLIGLVIVVCCAIAVIIYNNITVKIAVKNLKDDKQQASIKTNLSQLQASKYTGAKFDKVKIGDSLETVNNILGKGEYIGTTANGYEVYEYHEEAKSTYQMYYQKDKLKEVGVILNN